VEIFTNPLPDAAVCSSGQLTIHGVVSPDEKISVLFRSIFKWAVYFVKCWCWNLRTFKQTIVFAFLLRLWWVSRGQIWSYSTSAEMACRDSWQTLMERFRKNFIVKTSLVGFLRNDVHAKTFDYWKNWKNCVDTKWQSSIHWCTLKKHEEWGYTRFYMLVRNIWSTRTHTKYVNRNYVLDSVQLYTVYPYGQPK